MCSDLKVLDRTGCKESASVGMVVDPSGLQEQRHEGRDFVMRLREDSFVRPGAFCCRVCGMELNLLVFILFPTQPNSEKKNACR